MLSPFSVELTLSPSARAHQQSSWARLSAPLVPCPREGWSCLPHSHRWPFTHRSLTACPLPSDAFLLAAMTFLGSCLPSTPSSELPAVFFQLVVQAVCVPRAPSLGLPLTVCSTESPASQESWVPTPACWVTLGEPVRATSIKSKNGPRSLSCGTPGVCLQKQVEFYSKTIFIAVLQKYTSSGLYAKYQHIKTDNVNLFCWANSYCTDLRIEIFLPSVCICVCVRVCICVCICKCICIYFLTCHWFGRL